MDDVKELELKIKQLSDSEIKRIEKKFTYLLLVIQGEISTLMTLDREIRDSYVFTVQATDNGHIPLSGYTSVRELLLTKT